MQFTFKIEIPDYVFDAIDGRAMQLSDGNVDGTDVIIEEIKGMLRDRISNRALFLGLQVDIERWRPDPVYMAGLMHAAGYPD